MTRLISTALLLAGFLLLLFPANAQQLLRKATEVEKPAKTDRIAIIGGGVHGIFTARALKKRGYSNIVVYEKEQELAGITESFQADGAVFDYTTKFIPADTVNGPGMPTELSSLIDEYGLTVRPYAVPVKNYEQADQIVYPLPKVLLPYVATPEGQQLLVSNMIAGFELLKAVAQAGNSPEALINAGIVFKTETWEQFAERIQLPAFTDLCEFLHNLFLGGPSNVQPAATVLHVRRFYIPSYIKSILQGFGIGPDTALPISDELRSVLSNPFPGTSYVINEGYQALFDAIVLQEQIEVCLGCEVTKIKKQNDNAGGDVNVWAGSNGKDSFDHVIISSRPHDSMSFLLEPSVLKDRVSEAADVQKVFTFAFRTQSIPAALGDPFVAVFYPAASNSARDGTVTAIAKDFPSSNVCVGIGYSDSETSVEDGLAIALSDLGEYEFAAMESDVIDFKSFIYPSVPRADAVAEDWFAKMTELQGVNNIYLVGEALSGFGVPVALSFVTDFVEAHFSE